MEKEARVRLVNAAVQVCRFAGPILYGRKTPLELAQQTRSTDVGSLLNSMLGHAA